ncbi:MAG: DUF2062 domain-containing protein [Nannocystaceae bacterium]
MRRFRAWLTSLLSLNGSPRGIAAGFAVGLGLSLVPIPFAGMFVALALVPVLRVNPVSTYLGTAVVNPVTGPFIYFFELWLGMRLFGLTAPSWAELRALDGLGWWRLFRELLGPFLAGGGLLFPCAAALSYVVVFAAVRRWRAGVRGGAAASERADGALSSAANARGSVDGDDGAR